jgi:hypothetical protein
VSSKELRESSRTSSTHLRCQTVGHSGNTCEGLKRSGKLHLKRDKYGSGKRNQSVWRFIPKNPMKNHQSTGTHFPRNSNITASQHHQAEKLAMNLALIPEIMHKVHVSCNAKPVIMSIPERNPKQLPQPERSDCCLVGDRNHGLWYVVLHRDRS